MIQFCKSIIVKIDNFGNWAFDKTLDYGTYCFAAGLFTGAFYFATVEHHQSLGYTFLVCTPGLLMVFALHLVMNKAKKNKQSPETPTEVVP